MRSTLLPPALLLAIHATGAGGQIQGTVHGSSGEPLPDVTVELWGPAARPTANQSDASGHFRFTAEHSRGSVQISLRKIGYRTHVRRLAPGDTILAFTLAYDPIALEGIQVTARSRVRPCPNRDQPEARALWRATSGRYRMPDDGDHFLAMTRRFERTVTETERDLIDDSLLQSGWHWLRAGGYDAIRNAARPLGELVRQRGYAWAEPIRSPGYVPIGGEFFAWRYPMLHDYRAHHFLSDAFADLHTISVYSRDDKEVVLGFCPARRNLPSIQGTLTINIDSTVAYAQWSFITPRPRENAGGEVVFMPWEQVDTRLPIPTAARGVYWRQMHGRQLYYQQATESMKWDIGPNVEPPGGLIKH